MHCWFVLEVSSWQWGSVLNFIIGIVTYKWVEEGEDIVVTYGGYGN